MWNVKKKEGYRNQYGVGRSDGECRERLLEDMMLKLGTGYKPNWQTKWRKGRTALWRKKQRVQRCRCVREQGTTKEGLGLEGRVHAASFELEEWTRSAVSWTQRARVLSWRQQGAKDSLKQVSYGTFLDLTQQYRFCLLILLVVWHTV